MFMHSFFGKIVSFTKTHFPTALYLDSISVSRHPRWLPSSLMTLSFRLLAKLATVMATSWFCAYSEQIKKCHLDLEMVQLEVTLVGRHAGQVLPPKIRGGKRTKTKTKYIPVLFHNTNNCCLAHLFLIFLNQTIFCQHFS